MACQSGSFQSQQEEECFRDRTFRHKKLPFFKKVDKPLKQTRNMVKSASLRETISHNNVHKSIEMLNRQEIEQYIGLLESRWTNSSNQTIGLCFGTAFAIAQDVILTCAHNIFSQLTCMVCDQIKFIPGKVKSSDVRKKNTYTSTSRQIAYEKLGFFERYSQKPLSKDFAVILLNRQLPFHNFLNLTTRELVQGQSIEIIGYPRKRQQKSKLERVDLQGEVIQTRAHIIVHNMKSQSGHSGSPILCRTKVNGRQKYEVCGIHSHKGPLDYNRGIAITTDTKLKIDEMIFTLREKKLKP